MTPAGAVLYDVNLELPEAPDLTPFPGATTLVAWAATPQFDSEMRLGEVRPGVTRVGRIPFDRFLVLVSAEPSARVTERTGRVLLRGTSATIRMQPHDLAFLLAGLLNRGPSSNAAPGFARAPHDQGQRLTALPAGRLDTAADAPGGGDAARVDDAEAGRVVVPAAPRRARSRGRVSCCGWPTATAGAHAAPVRRVLFGRTWRCSGSTASIRVR